MYILDGLLNLGLFVTAFMGWWIVALMHSAFTTFTARLHRRRRARMILNAVMIRRSNHF